MKIGIVTFHFAYNYGAVLQAWALQEYLERQGNDVSIIDYRPLYHSVRYDIRRKLMACYRQSMINGENTLRAMKAVIGAEYENLTQRSSRTERSINFEDFISHHLKTTKRYISIDELKTELI